MLSAFALPDMFLWGVVLAVGAFLGFIQLSRAMRFGGGLRHVGHDVLFLLSPVFTFTHELGHVIVATLLGCPVTSVRIGFYTDRVNQESGIWRVGTGEATFIVSSNLKNGLVCAGPLLLWVPLAGYLTVNPLFESALLNGLLVGHLLQAGFEVFWSEQDRTGMAVALAPLGYLMAAISFALVGFLNVGLSGYGPYLEKHNTDVLEINAWVFKAISCASIGKKCEPADNLKALEDEKHGEDRTAARAKAAKAAAIAKQSAL